MTKVADCPFEIKPREKFMCILGKQNGYYESDEEWIKDNMDACIWFLRQLVKDPCDD